MQKAIYALIIIVTFSAAALLQEPPSKVYPFSAQYDSTRTILRVIPSPAGYDRIPLSKLNLFMSWLTNLPLRDESHPVIRWDRQILIPADSIAGIIDLEVSSYNQRNADMPLQMVIEYQRARGKLDYFPVILGRDTLTIDKWLNGRYSTDARGNLKYIEGEKREPSGNEYVRFLEFIMTKNDINTLLDNLTAVNIKDLRPGDVYVQRDEGSDSVGHAAMIFDVAQNRKGDLMLLVGWGGNPAHSYYLARPRLVEKRDWFTIDEFRKTLAGYGAGKFYRLKNIEK